MILKEEDAIYAANKFIDYFSSFNRIDDYLRYVKGDRVEDARGCLFAIEDDFFQSFDMSPNDMDFEIHIVDDKTKWNSWTFFETLNLTASNAIETSIPGRNHKWIVIEKNTSSIVGVVRFGSPTVNSKPRNDYFDRVVPLSEINQHFVMGFNIVPVQPFGYNYLGGKLLALLACSDRLKREFDNKYGTELKYFETTSLYGTTKGVSMYDGLKPFMRHIGDTVSDFTPLLHDDVFKDLNRWFIEKNDGTELIKADASSRKLKIQTKMISIIKKSLPSQKVVEFTTAIANAKNLTEKKRYYFSQFNHTPEEAIEWWKKKATKRYEKLKSEGRLRTELELWKKGSNLEIIR
tara:strand:- start:388 stop:1431 length:1044 start_codon:yes stop_codon:yes gene_type:complete